MPATSLHHACSTHAPGVQQVYQLLCVRGVRVAWPRFTRVSRAVHPRFPRTAQVVDFSSQMNIFYFFGCIYSRFVGK